MIKRKEKTVELEHMDKANIIGPSYARKKQAPADNKTSVAKKKAQTPSKEQLSKESSEDQEDEDEEHETPPPPKPVEKPEKPPKKVAVEKHDKHDKERDDRIEMRKRKL